MPKDVNLNDPQKATQFFDFSLFLRRNLFFLNTYIKIFDLFPKTEAHVIKLYTNNKHTQFSKQYLVFGCAMVKAR